MNKIARAIQLQNSKSIYSNGNFLSSMSISNLLNLDINIPYYNNKPINKNKVNDIANIHKEHYLTNNNYNSIHGVLTLNATVNNIYLLDGIHRYKAYHECFNKHNMKDFNVNIEYWGVNSKEEVLNNYNLMNNVIKYKRKGIPKKLKQDVWDKYIGNEHGCAKCYVCKNTIIDKSSFICGHIEPIVAGGKTIIHNLRPICNGCNSSMGIMYMDEYIKKYYPDNYISFTNGIAPVIYYKLGYKNNTYFPIGI